jgi:Zn-dependent membrane protease YugP
MMPFYFSPMYLIFMIPAFALMGFTSWYVRHNYSKWSQIRASSGLTGHMAAQRLISTGNLYGVQVQGTAGQLTDHYDPRNKTLYLSQGVGDSPSVAAVAIAAHELGHAMQDAEDYFPMRIRSGLVPAVSIGSNLGWILIIIGLMLRSPDLAWIGVIAFRVERFSPSQPCLWNLTLRRAQKSCFTQPVSSKRRRSGAASTRC